MNIPGLAWEWSHLFVIFLILAPAGHYYMEKFGIRDVEGRKDIELAERLGSLVIY